jgi:TAT (twin-arginine translocation) pathway signal sequence
MKDLRLSRRQVLKGAGAVGVLGALGIPTTVFADSGDGGAAGDGRIRWDLISLVFPDINAGGTDIASATTDYTHPVSAYTTPGSTLTLTGSGTFRPGQSGQVTGGGTWSTNNPAVPGGPGTYRVTELVSWIEAPGTLAGNPVLHDHIGNLVDTRAGLAVLRIKYSDRLDGILFLSCNLNSPASVDEGINASRGFVNFYAPTKGSTLFHVLGHGEKG